MTPDKSAIERMIAREIVNKLNEQGRSKNWLAARLKMDYGKVKRVLSEKNPQQLSLSDAEAMLNVLGSSLYEIMLGHVISSIRADIERDLARYERWRPESRSIPPGAWV